MIRPRQRSYLKHRQWHGSTPRRPAREMVERLLLIAVCLMGGGGGRLWSSASSIHLDSGDIAYDWPCPQPGEISPCRCYTDPDHHLELDCSDVQDNAELARVFKANFVFTTYDSLLITPPTKPAGLNALKSGVFGQVTFRSINITNTPIRTVENGALDTSFDTLENLLLADNEIKDFPFSSITNFALLRKLHLEFNQITVLDDITSDSLDVISLAGNSGLSIPSTTFIGATGLQELYLYDMQLNNIPANLFRSLTSPRVIILANNNFKNTLEKNFVNPQGKSLEMLHLNDNKIAGIRSDSISGLKDSAQVSFRFNLIDKLEKGDWENLVNQVRGDDVIDLRDNQLVCGCDVYWLVLDRVSMNKIHKETKCISGFRLHDLPLSIFPDYCDLPTGTH